MLSRNAYSLYWLGRYLERAEHLSRLLHLQVETLVDRSRREIHYGWRRIYGNLQRRPPLASADFELYDSDDLTLADAYTLADDLTCEASNPDSLHSCIASGRENARQSRNCISHEMWVCLNRAWLQLKDIRFETIWSASPEHFYEQTTQHLCTFIGTARVTMYRAQGWGFMQVGRALERAQQTISLLLTQLAINHKQNNAFDADWLSLLHLYQALDAYRWNYSVQVDSAQVLQLLVNDPRLPRSLEHALQVIVAEIATLPVGTVSSDHELRQLCAELSGDTQREHRTKLERAREKLNTLDQLIVNSWFDYGIEDHLPRHDG